jgi:uncharacterized protein
MGTDRTATDAWSVDGRTFSYRGPLGDPLPLGGYVALDGPQGTRTGQVLSQRLVTEEAGRTVHGHGRLIDPGPTPVPFEDAEVRPAPDELVRLALARAAAPLEVGTLRANQELPAVLEARGFNRHTFLCGQSGSGKTYALGLLLERLLLHTSLPMLVLDPNGDHVRIRQVRDGVDDATARAHAEAASDVRVLRAMPDDTELPLRIRFNELGDAGSAALLQLDPIGDRDEFNALLHVRRDSATSSSFRSVEEALHAFRASGDPVLDLISKRTENLGVDRMLAWATGSGRTLSEIWQEDRPRALIADSSGFEGRRERIAVAVAVMQQLWARRNDRRPLLLVVDEAHDVCPADPTDPLQHLAVELFTRIAGEGRKYGIHLLLASQRPDKLPDNVLSQCDNLLLMRVNSNGDRAALAERFGFAPPDLVGLSGDFGLGEALIAGQIAPAPLLVRMGRRITPEGGADIPTDWAT